MMTAAQQHRHLGVSAEASDDMIVVQIGSTMRFLRPVDMRVFLKCAANAMFRAEMAELENELAAEDPRGSRRKAVATCS